MKKPIVLMAALMAGILVFVVSCNKSSSSGGFGKRAAITVEVFDRGTDGGKTNPAQNNWTDWIKKKVLEDENIEVSFVPVSRWEEVTALNNMMAAGEPPDVCLTYSNELIASYRDFGGLFDMAPHIDTSLADLKAFLGPDTALPGRDLIRRNEDPQTGAIYAIPARRVVVAMRNIFIRKDWLDKLGLPLPSTTEEFYSALKAFKEKDPGGIGKNNVIPFTMGSDVFWTTQAIVYPFIDPNLSLEERWINIVVDRYITMPGYKEGIRFINKLYNGGLVDKDFPLYKGEEQFNYIKNGYVGSYTDNWDRIYRDSESILKDLQTNIPGAELVPVNSATDADGVARRSAYDPGGVNFFIPAASKNPEAAMRYLNWLSRYENYHFLQVGPEGITHDMIDGIPKLKTAQGPWIQNSPQNIDYTITINGLDLGDPDLNVRALANGYSWPAELIENAYRIAMFNALPDPVIPVSLSAAGPVVQTLIDKGNVFMAQAVVAKPEDFDRVWDAGLRDWLLSGGQSVIDEKKAKFYIP
jgi:putative aldouronate transport system substrate-binding protein